MTQPARIFPAPWRRIEVAGGHHLVIDGEGKRLCVVYSEALEQFDRLSRHEAELIADTIVRIPALLDLEAAGLKPLALQPALHVKQSGDCWYILREADGVIQRSRPFASREAATYACVVFYGGEPVGPPIHEAVASAVPAPGEGDGRAVGFNDIGETPPAAEREAATPTFEKQ